jgi:HEAT repeat protein
MRGLVSGLCACPLNLTALLIVIVLPGMEARCDSPAPPQEEVEVIVAGAKIKVEQEVIARVNQGDRLTVLRREGPWIGVETETAVGPRRGWILATTVRPVVACGIDDRSTAPPAPVLASLAVDYLQGVLGLGAGPMQCILCFQLTIANQSGDTIAWNADEIQLQVGDDVLKSLPLARRPSAFAAPIHILLPENAGVLGRRTLDNLPRLGSQELAAGEEVVGWLTFELPRSVRSGLFSGARELPEPWLLSFPLGTAVQQVDLRKEELAHGPRIRPSTIDESVPVVEMGSRLNLLNIDAWLVPVRKLLKEKRAFVVLFRDTELFVDQMARTALMNTRPPERWSQLPVYWIFPPRAFGTVHSLFVGGGTFRGESSSEEDAVVEIMSERGDATPILVRHLRGGSKDARAAAAERLAADADQPEVFNALAAATRDDDARVRAASIRAIDQFFRGPQRPPSLLAPASDSGARRRLEGELLETILAATHESDIGLRSAALGALRHSQDPRATRIIIAALRDSEWIVRSYAAHAARHHPADLVAEPLMELLDHQQLSPYACHSLAELRYQPAIPKLKELRAGASDTVAAAAIQALYVMGEMSVLEVAVAKLERGVSLSRRDRHAIVKSDDEALNVKLKEMLSREPPSWQAACLLAEMGDACAYDVLIELAAPGGSQSFEDVCRALGALGDKRAVEPLREKLAVLRGWRRAPVLQALMMLEAPGVFEQTVDEIATSARAEWGMGLLAAVGRAAGNRAVPVLARYLDDDRLWRVAATGLWDVATPEAMRALSERLAAEQFTRSEQTLAALMEHAGRQAQEGDEDGRDALVRKMRGLLRELENGDNPATRQAARDRLRMFPVE